MYEMLINSDNKSKIYKNILQVEFFHINIYEFSFKGPHNWREKNNYFVRI